MSEEKEETLKDIGQQLDAIIDKFPESIREDMKEKIHMSAYLAEIEIKHEWRKWAHLIPFIKWPDNWFVKAVPPFAGAVIRYYIKNDLQSDEQVSVYLDCYDMLGCWGSPYWEVYNTKFEGSEPARCSMEDIEGKDGLIQLIKIALREVHCAECAEE